MGDSESSLRRGSPSNIPVGRSTETFTPSPSPSCILGLIRNQIDSEIRIKAHFPTLLGFFLPRPLSFIRQLSVYAPVKINQPRAPWQRTLWNQNEDGSRKPCMETGRDVFHPARWVGPFERADLQTDLAPLTSPISMSACSGRTPVQTLAHTVSS